MVRIVRNPGRVQARSRSVVALCPVLQLGFAGGLLHVWQLHARCRVRWGCEPERDALIVLLWLLLPLQEEKPEEAKEG